MNILADQMFKYVSTGQAPTTAPAATAAAAEPAAAPASDHGRPHATRVHRQRLLHQRDLRVRGPGHLHGRHRRRLCLG